MLIKSMQIIQLTKLTTDQLLELETLEQEIFADGALNRWTLPVIANYGYLFAVLIFPFTKGESLSNTPSPLRGEGEIVGLASFISKKEIAFLVGLWIKDGYRNQGLGKKLLTDSILKLEKDGFCSIELTVDPNNLCAVSLYQKLGFKEKEKLRDFYGPKKSRLLFQKRLSS